VCVCVCVCERGMERDTKRESEREKERAPTHYTLSKDDNTVQGYPTHKKTPTPLGPP
jgi:hypothetical protein